MATYEERRQIWFIIPHSRRTGKGFTLPIHPSVHHGTCCRTFSLSVPLTLDCSRTAHLTSLPTFNLGLKSTQSGPKEQASPSMRGRVLDHLISVQLTPAATSYTLLLSTLLLFYEFHFITYLMCLFFCMELKTADKQRHLL